MDFLDSLSLDEVIQVDDLHIPGSRITSMNLTNYFSIECGMASAHWLRFFFGLTPGAEIGYDVRIL